MKIKFFTLIILVLLSSCDQFDIFYKISNEVAPKEPKIEGSPSKIVKLGDRLYVANGNLWEYKSDNWEKISKPSGNVIDVAAGSNKLFIMDKNYNIYFQGTDASGNLTGGWSGNLAGINTCKIAGSEAIFAANDILFGSQRSDMITGVVFLNSKYYFATPKGVSTSSTFDGVRTLIEDTKDSFIKGIVVIDTNIVAVSSGGYIYQISSSDAVTPLNKTIKFTGAIAIWTPQSWTSGNNGRLLLLGVDKNTDYNYGYREVNVDGSGILDNSFSEPGESIENHSTYLSTMDLRAVNSIIQAPNLYNSDGKPVLFASTQQSGLWACRNGEWNAEDK
jgi:hypothetical protein